MSERDLIERLEEATLQWLELRDEENAALAQEASDAIARLSEALAEAEKKGDEDWRDMASAPRDASEIIVRIPKKSWPGYYRQIAHWAEGGGDDQPPFRGWFRFMADGYVELPVKPTGWMPLPAPPRDLSQGGQHG